MAVARRETDLGIRALLHRNVAQAGLATWPDPPGLAAGCFPATGASRLSMRPRVPQVCACVAEDGFMTFRDTLEIAAASRSLRAT